MDQGWIKNLAKSTLVGEELCPSDPAGVKEKVTADLMETIPGLIDEVEGALIVYNLYKDLEDQIRLTKLSMSIKEFPYGFILFTTGCQYCVEQREHRIEVRFKKVTGFENQQRLVEVFLPKIDRFGGLLWKSRGGDGPLTLGLVAQLIIEKFCLTSAKNL